MGVVSHKVCPHSLFTVCLERSQDVVSGNEQDNNRSKCQVVKVLKDRKDSQFTQHTNQESGMTQIFPFSVTKCFHGDRTTMKMKCFVLLREQCQTRSLFSSTL